MSPVEQSRGHVGRAATVALVGVIIMGLGLWLATVALNREPSTDLKIGDPTFQGGTTDRLSKEIAARGPILYSDVSGRKDRDMILQHLGSKKNKGWTAFLAAPVDKPRDCTWSWRKSEQLFRASCDTTITAPASGEGLPQFKVTITGGHIDVDLNADARKGSKSGSGSTTTSTPG